MELLDTLCKEDRLTVTTLIVDFKRGDRQKLSRDDVSLVIDKNCKDISACKEVFEEETNIRISVTLEELMEIGD